MIVKSPEILSPPVAGGKVPPQVLEDRDYGLIVKSTEVLSKIAKIPKSSDKIEVKSEDKDSEEHAKEHVKKCKNE